MWGKDQWGGFCQAQAQRFFWGYWKQCVQFQSWYIKYFPWKVCQKLNPLNWTTIIKRKVKVYFLSKSFVSFTIYCWWAYIPFYFGSVKALKTIICFLYSISRQKKCWMRKTIDVSDQFPHFSSVLVCVVNIGFCEICVGRVILCQYLQCVYQCFHIDTHVLRLVIYF